MTDLTVKELDRGSRAAWDAYVTAHPDATFFHRAGWRRVVEESFDHPAPFLYVEREGRIVGVLPLVHMRSRLFGHSLVSTPFCVYGGPIADDEEALQALDDAAWRMAERLGVDRLEYRSVERRHPDWPAKEGLYATFRRTLDPDPDRNLKAIPRKQRAVVRKALARNLGAELDDGPERLYPLYAESVRNLGTPVFPRRYFQNLKEEFGEDCEILTVTADGTPVAGLLSFYFRDEVLPYYAGGTPASRDVGGHDFMYWDVMRRACVRGIRVFDFGRSKDGTGPYAFKKNWGFEPTPLAYEFRLRGAAEIPDVNPLNPKFRLFVAMWKRLPLPVANLVGPSIVRNLG